MRTASWLLALAAGCTVGVASADEAAKPASPTVGHSAKAVDTPAGDPPTKPPAATDAVVLDATSLETIISRSVKSSTGEDMGRIVDMLVVPAGQVRAAVIDFGGFLGVGSRKIAVDWKALNFDDVAKSGNVIVALGRNQVRMAPEYKQGDPIVILEATSAEEAKKASEPKPAPATKPDGVAPSLAEPTPTVEPKRQ